MFGLDRWRRPEGWDSVPFTHTITYINSDWSPRDVVPFIGGAVLGLVEHPADKPFARGEIYVWCKQTWMENGGARFPTSPLFGRYIEATTKGPKALIDKGIAGVIGPPSALCIVNERTSADSGLICVTRRP